MKKIKDKIEYIPDEAQGSYACEHDCIVYKNKNLDKEPTVVDGKISREAFWDLAKFKKPTHQISFHTARALTTLKFLKGSEVKDEE